VNFGRREWDYVFALWQKNALKGWFGFGLVRMMITINSLKIVKLHNESDYEKAVSLLDSLIDVVGENEKHPLASLMELVGFLIEQYENLYVPEI
jgi:hypothetical protein